ncbi:MAG: tetratricopeptide repeat protein [candidate division FCPU426 bacterium]
MFMKQKVADKMGRSLWLCVIGFLLCLPVFSLAEDKSLSKLQATVAAEPNNPNAHFNLGLYFYQKGRYEDAIKSLTNVISIDPQDEEALVLLGAVHLRLGQLGEAEKYLNKTLTINANNIDARNNLSLVYFNQNKVDQAINSLQESLRLQSDNVDALTNLAFIYSTLNRIDEAVGAYKRLIKADPKSLSAYDRLAQLYLDQQKYSDVIKLVQQSKGNLPENATMLNHLAFASLYKGEMQDAFDNFTRASRINPGDAVSQYGLGLIAYKNANLEIAIKKFKQALKLNKNYMDAYRQIAIAYEDKGEYIKALYYYRQMLKLQPDDRTTKRSYSSVRAKAIDHYLRKGSKDYFEGDFEEAVQAWNNVLKLDPKNETANKFIQTAQVKLDAKIKEHVAQGETFLLQNMQQDAYREFHAALKLDPKNSQARAGLDKVQLKKQEKEEIGAALALDSIKHGNMKAALQDFKTTLKRDPSNLLAQKYVNQIQNEQKSGTEKNYRKGIELLSQGKLREAIFSLERAAELDSNDQGIKNLLYKTRTQLRENVKALMARGVELVNSGRATEAKEKFNEVLKLDPDNAEASEYLTNLTGKAAQVTVSKEEIKKLYYDGVSLYLDGQNRRAIEVWRKILVLDPENQEAKSSITKAEMELKEMEKRGIKTQ